MALVSIHSCYSRGLIVAAPSYVFTISRVAKLLGGDENRLYDIASNMEPEDNCLTVLRIDDVSNDCLYVGRRRKSQGTSRGHQGQVTPAD